MTTYLLFESASGFGLFERTEEGVVEIETPNFQETLQEFNRFNRIVKLIAFYPFPDSESALQTINSVSEGLLTDQLTNFLETHLPTKGKKEKIKLGVADDKLGSAVTSALELQCVKNKSILELLRGIRLHFHKFIKALKKEDLIKAQLSLGHAYSRAKVKFNVNRSDNMIIQSISLLDTLDKDINTFAMRVKEWYSWHFPELRKLVNDNIVFAQLVKVIQNKSTVTENTQKEIEKILLDEGKAKDICDAARSSMGTDISELDMMNISLFAERVTKLAEYRLQLQDYLKSRMNDVAPSLSGLIGEQVGARLISKAGSLVNLAKYPASTVQILGAEKALFRALKTRGNTPKYGIIFHSSYIGRAGNKNKGRISRYLANKCSIAARIDAFSESPTNVFGDKLKEQVEERLNFYDNGVTPRKNIDVMHSAIEEAHKNNVDGSNNNKEEKMSVDGEKKAEKKKKKKKNKKKKNKKRKREDGDGDDSNNNKKEEKEEKDEKEKPVSDTKDTETPKKKKKRKKKKKKSVS